MISAGNPRGALDDGVWHGVSNSCAPSILLVDDEEDILPEYQEFLEFEGFPALICADPRQAFRTVVDQREIALVVTDLRMASLDGATLIRKLRETLPEDRRIAFIILTGDASAQRDAQTLGVPILTKPVDPAAFVAAIKTALAATE